jgi:hypothetical protein
MVISRSLKTNDNEKYEDFLTPPKEKQKSEKRKWIF